MKSDKNKQKDFHKFFTNDLSISFIPNNEDVTEEDGIPMYNLQDLQTYVREMISKITGTSYFGEDDEWDDEDDEEEYSSEYDYAESNVEEVDSDLLSKEMEVVENTTEHSIGKIDTTDASDDGFIIEVVRKK